MSTKTIANNNKAAVTIDGVTFIQKGQTLENVSPAQAIAPVHNGETVVDSSFVTKNKAALKTYNLEVK